MTAWVIVAPRRSRQNRYLVVLHFMLLINRLAYGARNATLINYVPGHAPF